MIHGGLKQEMHPLSTDVIFPSLDIQRVKMLKVCFKSQNLIDLDLYDVYADYKNIKKDFFIILLRRGNW